MELVIILIVLALLAFWVARIYNQLVELKNGTKTVFRRLRYSSNGAMT